MKTNHADFFSPGLPTPAAFWEDWPEFNFVGGHNDASSLPVATLRAAADRVLAASALLPISK